MSIKHTRIILALFMLSLCVLGCNCEDKTKQEKKHKGIDTGAEALKQEIKRLKKEISDLTEENIKLRRDIEDVMELGYRMDCNYPEHDSSMPFIKDRNKIPSIIKNVHPDPKWLRHAHLQGVVSLKVEIDEKGHVARACIVSGHQELRKYAQRAVLQWKYKPYLINNKPVRARFIVTINFSYSDYMKEK